MATLDERVAYLEGRVEEHARNTDGIREALVHLEERMDRRFDAVDTKIGRLTAIVVTALTAMLAIAGGALFL